MSGKSHVQVLVHVQLAAAMRGFKMVLFTASRGNNFVGGKCTPPSALLVIIIIIITKANNRSWNG